MTIDTPAVVSTIIGALILWFLKDNAETSRKLREEVVILKTQLEFIKAAINAVPVLEKQGAKHEKDLENYFDRLKKLEKQIGAEISGN